MQYEKTSAEIVEESVRAIKRYYAEIDRQYEEDIRAIIRVYSKEEILEILDECILSGDLSDTDEIYTDIMDRIQ
jgi:pantothenate kinase type III